MSKKRGNSALLYAVRGGHADIVRSLLLAGAKLHATKDIFLVAASGRNVEVLALLLDFEDERESRRRLSGREGGAFKLTSLIRKAFFPSKSLQEAVQSAAAAGNFEALRLLFGRGVKLSLKNKKRALEWVAQSGDLPSFRLLLSQEEFQPPSRRRLSAFFRQTNQLNSKVQYIY